MNATELNVAEDSYIQATTSMTFRVCGVTGMEDTCCSHSRRMEPEERQNRLKRFIFMWMIIVLQAYGKILQKC